MTRSQKQNIAIIGSGPAALMCATRLCEHPHCNITIFDQNKTPARKLMIAGRSGLNFTNKNSLANLVTHYRGPKNHFKTILTYFSHQDWIGFIEKLGFKSFEGSARRILLSEQDALPFANAWINHLKKNNVSFNMDKTFSDFYLKNNLIHVQFNQQEFLPFDAVCFALGGASYTTKSCDWTLVVENKKIRIKPFIPSNVGYEINWKKEFLQEAEGLALKNIVFQTALGKMPGELVITKYGLEGAPVYALGTTGTAYIDFKPDSTNAEIKSRLKHNPKKLSPFRLVTKNIKLSAAAQALLFHHTSDAVKKDLNKLMASIKHFPIELTQPRPLTEAISSAGGVCFSNCDENLMLKKFPGIYLAGEMLDWDAPTGGYLIQACVSQGAWVAHNILKTVGN